MFSGRSPQKTTTETEYSNVNMNRCSQPRRSEGDNPQLATLTTELRAACDEFKILKNELSTAVASLKLCEERLNMVSEKLNKTEERIVVLEKQREDCLQLRERVTELENEINRQGQSAVKNEIEITGLSENKHENLEHLVMVVAQKIGIALTDQDIDYAHRAGPISQGTPVDATKPKQPRAVVVRFVRKAKRDHFLREAKARKNLNNKDIVEDSQDRTVYVNERLTRTSRLLFRDARNRSQLAEFRYCWTKNGIIYVRRKPGSPPIQINSHLDLNKLRSPAFDD
ncbi:hypothetical protein NE865_05217 [Phthorimaea operculella]|nr:hypothetical protein NE865_05217 [Phthorimaea operculella]